MRFERLGDKVIQIRGISYKPKDISEIPLQDYVPVLKANNIKERGLDTSNLIYIHRSKIKPEQFIKKGDILLAASSGSKDIVGKNIFFESAFEGSFGAFCKLVRPNQKIVPEFLGVFFKTPDFKRHIRRLISGALINNLKNEHIDSLKVPTISFSDQHHIANILSKAENLIAQRNESIAMLDEFLKSTFLEMFGNTRYYEKTEVVKTIGEICNTRGGGTPSKAKSEYYTGDIPWVSPKDMKWLYITTSQDKITQQAITESSTALIPKGSLLMVIRSGILKSKLPLAINKVDVTINQDMKAFTSKEVTTEYLLYFFFSEERNILKKVKGTTADNLNFDDIKKMKIKIPPIELQNQFAQIVEKTEALKAQYQQSLQELENLYGSLSQRAFRGELKVAQPVKQKQANFSDKQLLAFYQKQIIGHVIKKHQEHRMEQGEMILAKDLYHLEALYGIKTHFQFKNWHYGTYDNKIRQLINGKDKYFMKKSVGQKGFQVLALGEKSEALFAHKYIKPELEHIDKAMDELLDLYASFPFKQRSHKIELLNTVCKSMVDAQSTELAKVREVMRQWETTKAGFKNKAEKFTEQETDEMIELIINKEWDKKLL